MRLRSRRRAGFALLFSFWSAALVALADAMYAGFLLNVKQYEWAAPFYQWLALNVGHALTAPGSILLYLALPLAIAGFWLSLSVVLLDAFLLKPLGLISLGLSGAALWYGAPGWALTGCGLAILLVSPYTNSFGDRLGALVMLLMPLLSFYFIYIANRQPKRSATTPEDGF